MTKESEENFDILPPEDGILGSIGDEYNQELEKAKAEDQQHQPEIVEEAKKFGHLDKDAWIAAGKDPNKWKSPDEFVQYGRQYKEFKDFISELKRQNAEQASKIDLLIEDRKKSALESVQEARKQLEQQLKFAKDTGDIGAVEQLAQKQAQLAQHQQQVEAQRRIDEINHIDRIFMERNSSWFNDARPDLKEKCKIVSQQIQAWYPGIPYAELAQRTEAQMRLEHPEINTMTSTAPLARPTVSMSNSNINKSVAGTGASDEERLYKSLTPEERAEFNVVKNQLANSKLKIKFTIQDYINQSNDMKKRGQ